MPESEKINEYREKGWTFRFDKTAGYIYAEHPNGGRQSVCIIARIMPDEVGFELTEMLNGDGRSLSMQRIEDELKRFVENQKSLPAEFSKTVDDHFWELVDKEAD